MIATLASALMAKPRFEQGRRHADESAISRRVGLSARPRWEADCGETITQ